MNWPELNGLWRRRDLPAVARHLRWLADHGVTVLRLILEYVQDDRRYIENPVGHWNLPMVQLWDDLFALCVSAGLRILLTPIDSFVTWVRWRAHPAQGENNAPACFRDCIDDIGPRLRALEIRLHGRAHLQCVSVFGPELVWKPWISEPIFRSRNIDFTTSRCYEKGTIDNPRDTVAPAVAVGKLVVDALGEIDDGRPFFDSEHGSIHSFKDHGRTLPEAFDDECFCHIQEAHLAAGEVRGRHAVAEPAPARADTGRAARPGSTRALSAFTGLATVPTPAARLRLELAPFSGDVALVIRSCVFPSD